MKNNIFKKSANSLTQNVVSTFSSRLKDTLGENLQQIILFGSRARGDNSKYSDFDFVVVLDQKDTTTIDTIRSIEVEMMDTFDVLVSALAFSTGDWQKRQTLPLGLNVQREGIAVW
jgi:uncharacterized protein